MIQILLFLVLIVVDQLTKHWAVLKLKGQPSIPLIKNVLEFRYLENNGAAFGFLQNKQWLFYVITVIVLLAIGFVFVRIVRQANKYAQMDPEKVRKKTLSDRMLLNYVLVVLAAGAVGNLIDRIAHNYVVDFIYFRLINFPIFNFADICVTLSAIFMVIFLIFIYKDDPEFTIFSKKKENG
ncbi:MAG: signal peptidase II [Lachnospiraceae bacterium]|nr:signal peptidase II [Lachnospiraceae bacterium]